MSKLLLQALMDSKRDLFKKVKIFYNLHNEISIISV